MPNEKKLPIARHAGDVRSELHVRIASGDIRNQRFGRHHAFKRGISVRIVFTEHRIIERGEREKDVAALVAVELADIHREGFVFLRCVVGVISSGVALRLGFDSSLGLRADRVIHAAKGAHQLALFVHHADQVIHAQRDHRELRVGQRHYGHGGVHENARFQVAVRSVDLDAVAAAVGHKDAALGVNIEIHSILQLRRRPGLFVRDLTEAFAVPVVNGDQAFRLRQH